MTASRTNTANRSGPTFCWWCNGSLVGPGGVAGREPLSFRTVKTMPDGKDVRVHVVCEDETKRYFTVVTAQEKK